MVYKYLGYGITDNNGIAKLDHDADGQAITHSYTGSGAGKVDIVASLDDNSKISDSSIQSKTYATYDCMFYDIGTTGTVPSSWKIATGITANSNENGTIVSNNSSVYNYMNLNKDGTSSDLYDWNTPLCVEFDFEKLNTDASINSQIHFFDLENDNYILWLTTDGHYVIHVTENEVTATCNGVSKGSKTIKIDTTLIRWYLQSEASFRFKNFKVYPI